MKLGRQAGIQGQRLKRAQFSIRKLFAIRSLSFYNTLVPLLFHRFSRTNGVSIYKIATWLGEGIEVVQRSYGHLAPQDSEINRGV